jgi:hypothetical protein
MAQNRYRPAVHCDEREEWAMRVSAMVLGIIGGILGLIGALLGLSLAGANAALGGQADATAWGGGASTLALVSSVAAFIGAGLTTTKPRAAATLLLLASIGTLLGLGLFAILATPLQLIASLLAFPGRAPRVRAVPV